MTELDSQLHQKSIKQIQARSVIKLMLAMLVLGFVLGALNRPWGSIPPLGWALSPFDGLWLRPKSVFSSSSKQNKILLNGLQSQVSIQIDSDQIKHVFAENDEDLYFAQGWIHASERLWQMEFLTRAVSGRLAEVMGEKAIPIDKMFLKLGLATAAKETTDLMLQDRLVATALNAYTRGVNAFISDIDLKRLPFEYKLLGQKPEVWSVNNAGLLIKFMAFSLSGSSFDLPLSRTKATLSKSDFDELFPIKLSEPEPVISKSGSWQTLGRAPPAPLIDFKPDLTAMESHPIEKTGAHPENGSNNWAISGKRSTTGMPILSNDIHLNLTLPSLWYEIQLTSPTQNVYGISLPGAPGVILGFNEKLAWAVTNAETDVLDWFQLRFRDENKGEYLFEKDWRPVISREVNIQVKNQKSVPLTLRQTHFGPIVYEEDESPISPKIPKGLAMRWAGLEATNALKTFLLLNRASTVADCQTALENYYNPAQNFLCADNSNSIALWHMGRFPMRWQGQGRTISDGTSKQYEWNGYISRSDVPKGKNPDKGFLSSANQNPTDDSYPFYLGWWYGPPFRAMRINEILSEKRKFSPGDFIKMQMDTLSVPARMLTPVLLQSMESFAELSPVEKAALAELKKWDFHFSENSVAATVFHSWYRETERNIWSKYLPDPVTHFYPRAWTTIQLIIKKPNSKWFDDPTTKNVREVFSDIAKINFRKAIQEIISTFKTHDVRKWTWSEFHPNEFDHIGKIPGLGSGLISTAGVDWTILANQGKHGPVWKQVVALGKKPRAWGVYPGGQSGDPTSPNYDNFIQAWSSGNLKELSFLSSKLEQGPRHMKSITLEKAQ